MQSDGRRGAPENDVEAAAVGRGFSPDPAFLRFDEGWTQKGQTVSLTDNWTQSCVLGGTAASNCTAGTMKKGMTTHEFTVVSASECWDVSFDETFYQDSVNYQPAGGDPATCAYSSALLPGQ